ncbi:hypothetical protein BC941DRAFT_519291 [Chlamydoabsidia padenii]|nr:hypothetical protein BC941DRAFT_519291 [Chlamydoabsidia padenii]
MSRNSYEERIKSEVQQELRPVARSTHATAITSPSPSPHLVFPVERAILELAEKGTSRKLLACVHEFYSRYLC